MRRWQTNALGTTVALALVFFCFWIAIDSLTDGLCGNTPVQTVISPDGTRQAILFERNCGATTDFSSQVSIIGSSEELADEPGNVFAAERGHFGAAAPWGGPDISLRWSEGGGLVIRHDRWGRVHRSERARGDTQILYEPVD